MYFTDEIIRMSVLGYRGRVYVIGLERSEIDTVDPKQVLNILTHVLRK